MSREKRGEGVNRLLRRGAGRAPNIGLDQLPRSIQRVAEREQGVQSQAAQAEGAISPRAASTPSHQGGPDLRGDLVRKVVEMAKIHRHRELVELTRDEATNSNTKGTSEAQAGASLDDWYAQMKASGLSEVEIEEHMAQRLRAVRNSMLEFQHLRSTTGDS
ncbi:MAG: hypothetical protein CMP23_02210 [Rickettsiales bacterium]|nr:hypothetical protein [Rickettsiales bacterium]|tara:strand:+ start:80 stop:562 length:483 start_codon:yes stop_codon:yes gene_type:complete